MQYSVASIIVTKLCYVSSCPFTGRSNMWSTKNPYRFREVFPRHADEPWHWAKRLNSHNNTVNVLIDGNQKICDDWPRPWPRPSKFSKNLTTLSKILDPPLSVSKTDMFCIRSLSVIEYISANVSLFYEDINNMQKRY